MTLQRSYITEVRREGSKRAIVFVHGFSGDRDDTWDRFPSLIGAAPEVADWDIFTVGYDTTFLPDVAGVWSADPDLQLVATQYLTELTIKPLNAYSELALVAHSMGGLIVQYALTASAEVRKRVSHVALFGTPSNGLEKAAWFEFWKRQLRNMAVGSEFVTKLRAKWKALGDELPFELVVVAGSKDQFVPPESSLVPFPERFHRVVPGDHLQIVKPANKDAESVRLLLSCLSAEAPVPLVTRSSLRHAAELPAQPQAVRQAVQVNANLMRESDVVDAALALERAGKRDESIDLLTKHLDVGSDVRGTLAGRYKRLWLTHGTADYRQRARELYASALEQSERKGDSSQIYYHAINLAFLALAGGDQKTAMSHAQLALEHALLAPQDLWSVATQAEAHVYLGRIDKAIELYQHVPTLANTQGTEGWKLLSAGQQAFQIARILNDRNLADEIDRIFTLSGGRIFVSYAREDASWKDKFKRHLKPYLQAAKRESDLWEDSRLLPGQNWQAEIERALEHCRVGVLVVSEHFLNSDFIMKRELPILIKRAEAREIQLFWFVVSPCTYDATALPRFQAVSDPNQPLAELSEVGQARELVRIARAVRDAALEPASQTKVVTP